MKISMFALWLLVLVSFIAIWGLQVWQISHDKREKQIIYPGIEVRGMQHPYRYEILSDSTIFIYTK